MGARVRPAVLVVALLGCAPRPGAAPPSATPSTRTAGIANVTACVVADTSAPTRDTLYVVGVEAGRGDSGQPECERAATATSPVVITEKPGPDTDLRDVLDRGFPATHAIRPDVVVTRDPNVISYAAASAAYFTAVLPYDRTYTLAAADSTASVPSQAERDALARNAVTADVRGAAQPFAWLADASCVMPPAPAAV